MLSSLFWIELIHHYGYLSIFVLSVIEGPLVTIFAAALASQGLLDIWPVYGVVLAGDLTGDLAYYALGLWAIGPLARWTRNCAGTTFVHKIERLSRHLHAHAGRVLLFGKLTHSAGFLILLASGAARVRLSTYLFYNLFGALPKVALLITMGYYFGRFYTELSGPFKLISVIAFALVLMVLLFLARRIWLLPENTRDPR